MDAFLANDAFHATAHHIGLLDSKIDRLTRLRAAAWDQMLSSAARMFKADEIDFFDLVDLYDSMRTGYGPGFSVAWDRNMPVQIQSRLIRMRIMNVPNGPNGTWVGEMSLPDGTSTPSPGVSVVYVLFDEQNDPVYVGSTENLRTRLRFHAWDKPETRRWTAHPCRDREHAYQLEVQLLKQHKPRMNKRAGR
jgi:predicted GIY-YIG superfamily endonuclease